MKKINLVFFLICLSFIAKGQDSDPLTSHINNAQATVALASLKAVTVSLTVGASIPTGKYKATNRLDSSSGYARNGISYSVGVNWRIIDYIGISGAAGAMAHSMDVNHANKFYYPDNSTIEWNSLVPDYGASYYMAGFYVRDWAGDETRFSMYGRVLYGFTEMDIPALAMSGKTISQTVKLNTNALSATSTGFLFGLGARIVLTERVAFVLQADYILSKFDFGNVPFTIAKNGVEQTSTVRLDMPLNVFNYTAGLGFMF